MDATATIPRVRMILQSLVTCVAGTSRSAQEEQRSALLRSIQAHSDRSHQSAVGVRILGGKARNRAQEDHHVSHDPKFVNSFSVSKNLTIHTVSSAMSKELLENPSIPTSYRN